MTKAKVLYLAGPISAASDDEKFSNLMMARDVAKQLWAAGFAVICPHLNTAWMEGAVTYDQFIAGDLAILERCDAVVLLPRWEQSPGARGEVRHALARSKPMISWSVYGSEDAAALRDLSPASAAAETLAKLLEFKPPGGVN